MWRFGDLPLNAFINIMRPLAGAKLDNAKVGETVAARHQEMTGGVVLFEKRDVRGHVSVDDGELNLEISSITNMAGQLAIDHRWRKQRRFRENR